MSTYSDNLRIELITTGTQAGTWGTTTNTNLGTIIEDAIAGYAAVSAISANQAFTATNGAADEARCALIELSTTTGANFAVYAPPVSKQYIIWNNSSYTATIYNSTVLGNTTAAGTGVAIPAGDKVTVFSDGTNFYQAGATGTVKSVALSGGTTGLTVSGSPVTTTGTMTLAGTLAVANGGTGATTAATARTNLGATTVGGNMFTLTNPSAVTFLQVNADNTVSALDAASFRTAIGAGSGGGSVTSVALSGGTTGLTVSGSPITTSGTMTLAGTLAVANGGTGSTTASGARSALDVPSTSGSGATGTWGINISGNAATASSLSGSYVSSVDGSTGAVTLSSLSAFNRSLAQSGYQRLPGGLILQWGRQSSWLSPNFPVTFSSVYAAGVCGDGFAAELFVFALSNTTLQVGTNGNTGPFYWWAYGV